jgi:HlyD family secretion protein
MLKRVLGFLAVVGLLGLFASTLGFLWWKSRAPPEVFDTLTPAHQDIVVKTVATGAIVPRVEVDIKSRVSGVIATLAVEPGDLVAAGDLIATIQVVPDAGSLNTAQGRVRTASIAFDDAKARRERAESLFTQGAISVVERDRAVVDANLAAADLAAARNALTVVRDGAVRGSGSVATEVRSTVSGMVLAVPVEAGVSVIESNTFNDGTTIASVADMTDMVFEGHVDESEVGRIKEGMALSLTVGAIRGSTFPATLEYISPKGESVDGSVQFAIRAALAPVEDTFIRAGSSANADIVLDAAREVLAVDERAVHYDAEQPWVEVEVGEQTFERRTVELGLSDGRFVQVLSGLSAGDRVKKP